METVIEKIFQHAKEFPQKIALVFESEEITYGELWNASLRMYDYFRRAGVKKGDRVVCQSLYTRQFAVVCFATHLCHAIFVPVDKNANTTMLETLCKSLEPKCIVAKEKTALAALNISFSELDACIASGKPDAPYTFPEEDEYCNVLFTSGTTGEPKGVIWTQKTVTASAIIREELVKINEKSVEMTMAPLNHAAPMWKVYSFCYCGGTCIFLDGIIKLNKMNDYMRKYGVTSMYLPPSVINAIQQFAPNMLSDYAHQISYISIGSSGMSAEQQSYLREKLPYSRLSFVYGASEYGLVTSTFLESIHKPNNCVGKPCAGVSILIVDENMQPVATGETGILIVKSDMNTPGYWKRDDLNATMYYDGYFITSDLGYYDEDGDLFIVGRWDDLINVGGLKVFPTEIENEVQKIDSVKECICVPVHDDVTGQAVKLFVVKKEDSDLTFVNIRQSLTGKIDSYKIPKVMEWTDHIERTPNGKLNRKAYLENH